MLFLRSPASIRPRPSFFLALSAFSRRIVVVALQQPSGSLDFFPTRCWSDALPSSCTASSTRWLRPRCHAVLFRSSGLSPPPPSAHVVVDEDDVGRLLSHRTAPAAPAASEKPPTLRSLHDGFQPQFLTFLTSSPELRLCRGLSLAALCVCLNLAAPTPVLLLALRLTTRILSAARLVRERW